MGIPRGTVCLERARADGEGAVDAILKEMPFEGEAALLINGLGATSLEELYILCGDAMNVLKEKGVNVVRTFVGEFATSMEMAGASISVMKVDDEMKAWLDIPASTPFYVIS